MTVLDPGKHTFQEFEFEDFDEADGMTHLCCRACSPNGSKAICGRAIRGEAAAGDEDPVDCVVCVDLAGPSIRCPDCGRT